MGATAALLVFAEREIVLRNIGDSKIFRFSRDMLEQISKVHLAISVFGMKPPLSQNLGIPPTELVIEPYKARGKYNKGDIYLMCSDGLTERLLIATSYALLGILFLYNCSLSVEIWDKNYSFFAHMIVMVLAVALNFCFICRI